MQRSQAKIGAKQSGFTIAEIMAVVMLIALIAGVGGGIYMGTYKKMLVEKAARNFLLAAQYARIMAIEQQSQYEMHLDLVNGGFCLVTTQLDEDSEQAVQMIVQDSYCRPVEFEGDVRFEDVQVTPVSSETWAQDQTDEEQIIVFFPNGTADLAVVQIGDGKTHYTISISAATGKAKMYFGTTENVTSSSVDLDVEL